MLPARRWLGWFAAASVLLQGWLPVVVQASLLPSHRGERYAHDIPICSATTAAAATVPRPGQAPKCPVTHGAICLCAIFVSLLAPEPGPAPGPPPAIRSARRRLPTRLPVRSLPITPFGARAPPVFA
jgi:hypothetical protein